MNIIKAINDENLFKPIFRNLASWTSWMTLLRAFFGLQMDKADLDLYSACTGRESPPVGEFKELWSICGRRGGKSFMASVVSCYLALFVDYSNHLSPGERGVVQIIAADRAQAGVILKYCKGILHSNPVFSQYLESELRERVDLTNGISIEVASCSYKSIRGRTLVAAVCDEMSFWQSDGANPDFEILGALRPGLASIPTSKLIVISSPYARTGALFQHFSDYYGKDDDEILVWRSDTRTMNPTISEKLIARELEKDPSAARAEWLAEFREDIEQFLSPEAIEQCTVPGRISLPFTEKHKYHGFTDASGGRHDSFTMAIGHNSGGIVVIDYLFGRHPPFDPQQVVEEISDILRAYRVTSVTGDRYAGEWVSSSFEKAGIQYRVSELVKSDLYISLEMKINTFTIELPDNSYLQKELIGLERRRGRSGRDRIDHHPKGSDDYANSVAGISYVASKFTGLVFPELAKRMVSNG